VVPAGGDDLIRLHSILQKKMVPARARIILFYVKIGCREESDPREGGGDPTAKAIGRIAVMGSLQARG
jgi:hypothetical protein